MAAGDDDVTAIGIDLGTTNSCVALVQDGRPVVVPDQGGHRTTPSMICIEPGGHLAFGHRAKTRFMTHPQNTVYGFKRLQGRRFGTPEMDELIHHFFYEISPGEQGEPVVVVEGRQLSVEELSAMVLVHLKQNAEAVLEREVTHAVISVPAYFTQAQRKSVQRAGKMAGLQVMRVVNEPTAAALAYGFGKEDERRIMIFDLGGGTFDVTLLELSEEAYRVLGTGGNSFLGGIDFDNRMVEHLAKIFFNQHGVDISGDPSALQRLREAAERARIDLSAADQAMVEVPFLAIKGSEKLSFQHAIERKAFDNLVRPLVMETLKYVERTLREAGVAKEDVNDLIFVGGMTRTPLIKELVTQYFGQPPRKDVHPDEVVAMGAAILADALRRDEQAVRLEDVLPVSIGIENGDGGFAKVINKNTTVPTELVRRLPLSIDEERPGILHLYQGESREVAKNAYLGTLHAPEGLDPADLPEDLKFTFLLDRESVLLVMAQEPGSEQLLHCQLVTEPLIQREHYDAAVMAASGAGSATVGTEAVAGGDGGSPEAGDDDGGGPKIMRRIGKLFGRD